ncbi:MAG: gamma-D-glutamyl-L-lysine dipeptidyl-peptidase, partial [Actinomycetota bacterium]|nr:gamma-D-glutamyl-L-lysine dipeptidyl-peptidase [Actinomycetota bacterium]
NPADVDAWLGAMTVDDRRWLVGRLVTQALYGDQVEVVESAGGWTKVVVLRQPNSLDPRGYPGWLPTAQLTSVAPGAAGGGAGDAVVTRPAAALHDADRPDRAPMAVSFNTRLPVLSTDPTWVTVATPGGGRGLLSPADVSVIVPGTPPPTGDDVVRSAEQFAGVAYLWAGTSGAGWDCSGFTSAVYAAHGVVIPRDADDQAGAGAPVERDDLRPGDLLFYATGADRASVHHVGMYVGDGRMIQAPATGRTVETVSIDRPGLATEYWGARRYLPPSG